MEVSYSFSGITLSQHKYIYDLFNEKWYLECKPIHTPIDENHKLL